jgi:hypothetical protein
MAYRTNVSVLDAPVATCQAINCTALALQVVTSLVMVAVVVAAVSTAWMVACAVLPHVGASPTTAAWPFVDVASKGPVELDVIGTPHA